MSYWTARIILHATLIRNDMKQILSLKETISIQKDESFRNSNWKLNGIDFSVLAPHFCILACRLALEMMK